MVDPPKWKLTGVDGIRVREIELSRKTETAVKGSVPAKHTRKQMTTITFWVRKMLYWSA